MSIQASRRQQLHYRHMFLAITAVGRTFLTLIEGGHKIAENEESGLFSITSDTLEMLACLQTSHPSIYCMKEVAEGIKAQLGHCSPFFVVMASSCALQVLQAIEQCYDPSAIVKWLRSDLILWLRCIDVLKSNMDPKPNTTPPQRDVVPMEALDGLSWEELVDNFIGIGNEDNQDVVSTPDTAAGVSLRQLSSWAPTLGAAVHSYLQDYRNGLSPTIMQWHLRGTSLLVRNDATSHEEAEAAEEEDPGMPPLSKPDAVQAGYSWPCVCLPDFAEIYRGLYQLHGDRRALFVDSSFPPLPEAEELRWAADITEIMAPVWKKDGQKQKQTLQHEDYGKEQMLLGEMRQLQRKVSLSIVYLSASVDEMHLWKAVCLKLGIVLIPWMQPSLLRFLASQANADIVFDINSIAGVHCGDTVPLPVIPIFLGRADEWPPIPPEATTVEGRLWRSNSRRQNSLCQVFRPHKTTSNSGSNSSTNTPPGDLFELNWVQWRQIPALSLWYLRIAPILCQEASLAWESYLVDLIEDQLPYLDMLECIGALVQCNGASHLSVCIWEHLAAIAPTLPAQRLPVTAPALKVMLECMVSLIARLLYTDSVILLKAAAKE